MKRISLCILSFLLILSLCSCKKGHVKAKDGDLNISIPENAYATQDAATIEPFLGKWKIESISDANGTEKPKNSYYTFNENKKVDIVRYQDGETLSVSYRYKVKEDKITFTEKESGESIKAHFVFEENKLKITLAEYSQVILVRENEE